RPSGNGGRRHCRETAYIRYAGFVARGRMMDARGKPLDEATAQPNPDPRFGRWATLAPQEVPHKSPARPGLPTPEGVTVKPLYTEADLEVIAAAGFDWRGAIPGVAPYLRGPRATMYANRPWTIRQYSGFSTAEESNRFYRDNLAAGQMGLSI